MSRRDGQVLVILAAPGEPGIEGTMRVGQLPPGAEVRLPGGLLATVCRQKRGRSVELIVEGERLGQELLVHADQQVTFLGTRSPHF